MQNKYLGLKELINYKVNDTVFFFYNSKIPSSRVEEIIQRLIEGWHCRCGLLFFAILKGKLGPMGDFSHIWTDFDTFFLCYLKDISGSKSEKFTNPLFFLASFWNKVLMSNCAKLGRFPAYPSWHQLLRRSKENCVRNGQFNLFYNFVQLTNFDGILPTPRSNFFTQFPPADPFETELGSICMPYHDVWDLFLRDFCFSSSSPSP